MNTNKLVKIVLVIAALFIVYKIATRNRRGNGNGGWPSSSSPVIAEHYTSADDAESLPAGWAPTQRALPNPPPMSTSTDLLPKPRNKEQADFAMYAPKALQGVNLLDPTQTIGVDTQTSSLKLSSYDIRGYPVPNPRDRDVGPWNQSTYAADLMRKSLC